MKETKASEQEQTLLNMHTLQRTYE